MYKNFRGALDPSQANLCTRPFLQNLYFNKDKKVYRYKVRYKNINFFVEQRSAN